MVHRTMNYQLTKSVNFKLNFEKKSLQKHFFEGDHSRHAFETKSTGKISWLFVFLSLQLSYAKLYSERSDRNKK